MIKKGIILLAMILVLSVSAFAGDTLFINSSPIEFDEIKLEINGDTAYCDEDDIGDCDDELEEIRLDSEIYLTVTLENNADEEIEDVKVKVYSSNNDVDIDDRSQKKDIDDDDEEEFDFELELENDLEDGDDTDIDIDVTFDYNNVSYTLNYNFELEFEEPDYEIEVISEISSTFTEGENVFLCYEIINTGLKDQDHIQVTLNKEVIDKFKLEYDESKKGCINNINSTTGTNNLFLEVYHDASKSDYESVFLKETYEVLEKELAEEPQKESEIIVEQIEPEIEQTPVYATVVSKEKSSFDSEGKDLYIIGGAVILVLILILITLAYNLKK